VGEGEGAKAGDEEGNGEGHRGGEGERDGEGVKKGEGAGEEVGDIIWIACIKWTKNGRHTQIQAFLASMSKAVMCALVTPCPLRPPGDIMR